MGFLPCSSCVNSTVWMHHMDKAYRGKTTREMHKNVMSCIEQILKATSHKITVLWPPTSHLKNHPSKMNKACRTLLEMQEQNHQRCSPMDPFTYMCQYWTIKNVLTTQYGLEDLLGAKDDRNDWWEIIIEFRASSVTSGWWWRVFCCKVL